MPGKEYWKRSGQYNDIDEETTRAQLRTISWQSILLRKLCGVLVIYCTFTEFTAVLVTVYALIYQLYRAQLLPSTSRRPLRVRSLFSPGSVGCTDEDGADCDLGIAAHDEILEVPNSLVASGLRILDHLVRFFQHPCLHQTALSGKDMPLRQQSRTHSIVDVP
jgi:hypothetical protein